MADNKFTNRKRAIERLRGIAPSVRASVRSELDVQSAFLVEQIRPAIPKEHGDLAESLEWHRSTRITDTKSMISNVISEGRNQPGDTKGRKARAVEFGRPDMAAQPHFFPTYRANKKRIRSALMRAARAAIKKVIS